MTSEYPETVAELLNRADAAWNRLEHVIDTADDGDLAEKRDHAGWSAKDHLVHIAHWERSLIHLLAGQSRRSSLGVEVGQSIGDAIDDVNATVQAQTRDVPLPDVVAELRDVHARTRTAIAELTDEQLSQTIEQFVGDDGGDDPNDPVVSLLVADTYGHFDEHREWIEAILRT